MRTSRSVSHKKMARERAEKEAMLSAIYDQRNEIWQQAEEPANRACVSGFDNASRDLYQLADAYKFQN